jgi:hypothetical protein
MKLVSTSFFIFSHTYPEYSVSGTIIIHTPDYTIMSIDIFLPLDALGSGADHHEGVRRERLASLDQATASGQEVQRRKKKKKKTTKLQRQSTLIRREVESLPSFWPVFIILLSIGQVSLSLSYCCPLDR